MTRSSSNKSTSFHESTYLRYSDDVFATDPPRRLFRISIEKDYTAARIMSTSIVAIIITLTIQNFPDVFGSNGIHYFGIAGQLFLRVLNFLLFPLIGFSVVSGIAGLGAANARKITARAVAYYCITSLLACFIGIVLVTSIKPGITDQIPIERNVFKNTKILDSILNLIE